METLTSSTNRLYLELSRGDIEDASGYMRATEEFNNGTLDPEAFFTLTAAANSFPLRRASLDPITAFYTALDGRHIALDIPRVLQEAREATLLLRAYHSLTDEGARHFVSSVIHGLCIHSDEPLDPGEDLPARSVDSDLVPIKGSVAFYGEPLNLRYLKIAMDCLYDRSLLDRGLHYLAETAHLPPPPPIEIKEALPLRLDISPLFHTYADNPLCFLELLGRFHVKLRATFATPHPTTCIVSERELSLFQKPESSTFCNIIAWSFLQFAKDVFDERGLSIGIITSDFLETTGKELHSHRTDPIFYKNTMVSLLKKSVDFSKDRWIFYPRFVGAPTEEALHHCSLLAIDRDHQTIYQIDPLGDIQEDQEITGTAMLRALIELGQADSSSWRIAEPIKWGVDGAPTQEKTTFICAQLALHYAWGLVRGHVPPCTLEECIKLRHRITRMILKNK